MYVGALKYISLALLQINNSNRNRKKPKIVLANLILNLLFGIYKKQNYVWKEIHNLAHSSFIVSISINCSIQCTGNIFFFRITTIHIRSIQYLLFVSGTLTSVSLLEQVYFIFCKSLLYSFYSYYEYQDEKWYE